MADKTVDIKVLIDTMDKVKDFVRTTSQFDRMRGASPWIYPWGLDAPNKCLITS